MECATEAGSFRRGPQGTAVVRCLEEFPAVLSVFRICAQIKSVEGKFVKFYDMLSHRRFTPVADSPVKRVDDRYQEFVRRVSQDPGTIYVSEKLMGELRAACTFVSAGTFHFNAAVVCVDPLLQGDEMRFVKENEWLKNQNSKISQPSS